MKSSRSTSLLVLANMFVSSTLLLLVPVPVHAFGGAPSPAPSPTPTRVQFRPNAACTCSYQIVAPNQVNCNPPSICSCVTENNDLSTCACGIGDGDPMIRYFCDETDCCTGYGTRRHRSRHLQQLLGDSTDEEVTVMDPLNEEHQELYRSYLEKCGNVIYDISLVVTSHLYVVASPLSPSSENDPTAAECPFLVTHSYFSHSDTSDEEDGVTKNRATKQLLVWYDPDQGAAQFFGDDHWREKSYPVGPYPLHELAAAYEAVEVTGEYDLVTNNCAHYILRLAQQLEIPVDAQMTSFVTQRLLAESNAHIRSLLHDRVRDIRSASTNWILSLWNAFLSWCRQTIREWTGTTPTLEDDGDATIDESTEEELMKQLVGSTVAATNA